MDSMHRHRAITYEVSPPEGCWDLARHGILFAAVSDGGMPILFGWLMFF